MVMFCSSVTWQAAIQTINNKYRQCTYNVTLRRVRATIVVVDKQYVLHILSVCL